MKFNIHSKLNQAAVALALVVSVSACNDKDDVTPIINESNVSVINLLSDVAEVNAHIGENKINTETFKFASFEKYYTFTSAKTDLSIFETEKTDTLAAINYDFKSSEAYSAYVIDGTENAEIVVVSDNLKAATAGKAKVRLANFINNAEKIDLFVGETEEETADDITFKSVNEFAEVDAAEVTLAIKIDGQEEILASLENTKLESGKIYTVLAYETEVEGVTQVAIKLIVQK